MRKRKASYNYGWFVSTVLVVVLSACAPTLASKNTWFEAEGMFSSSAAVEVVSDTNASGGEALKYTGNASAVHSGQSFSSEVIGLKIVARAKKTDDNWPHLNVLLDGQNYADNGIATIAVKGNSYATYAVPINVPAGAHDVHLKALSTITEDQPLWVDKVTLDLQGSPPAGADKDDVPDTLDNCPSIDNPEQVDTDADLVGDACDDSPDVVCDKYASPSGSNTDAGTLNAPFFTAQKLLDSLSPGQTGCLRQGTYTQSDKELVIRNGGTSDVQRVTLTSYPGEKATYLGWLRIPSADYVTVSNMVLDGSAGPLNLDGTTRYSPSVDADHVRFIGNDVSNYSTGGCFQLGDASTVPDTVNEHMLLKDNFIHDCGGKRDGHGHAIYGAQTNHLQVIGNRIVKAESRGVRMHPDADHTLVANNVIDSNGLNVLIGGVGHEGSQYNEIRNNVIMQAGAPEQGWNVHANWNRVVNESSIAGNSVHHNCVWPQHYKDIYNVNGGVNTRATGFDAHNNVIAHPRFEKRPNGNYDLLPGNPCEPLLNGSP